MVFTIEVKKKRKDEEFGYRDLELFHGECYGGKLEWHGGMELMCLRCLTSSPIIWEDDRRKIVKTAIDGEVRKLTEAVIVVQKFD